MRRTIIFGLFLVLILIVSGCNQIKDMIKPTAESATKPECNKPYILVGWDCCLDQNDNKICDKDEIAKQEQITESEETEPIESDTKPTEPQISASDCIGLKVKYEEQEPYQTTETYTEIEKVRLMDPTPESLKQKILPDVELFGFTEEELLNDIVCCTTSTLSEVTCSDCFEEKLVQKTRTITKYKTVTKYKLEKLCGDKLKDLCTLDESGKTICPDYCEEAALGDIVCY